MPAPNPESSPAPTRPNVLLVISDQHIAGLMGCEGHAQAITPHMDRLAREGVRFSAAYTQNPICTPSRVSILSGQYCHNHGYYGLSGPRPDRLPHFLGHFREHGYRTAAIGKLHLPNDPVDWLEGGCDCVLDNMERTATGRYVFEADVAAAGYRGKSDHGGLPEFPGWQQHDARPSNVPFELSPEGWANRKAIEFMDDCGKQDRPFCMEVSYHRPHQCYTPAKQFWDMYRDDLVLPPTLDLDPAHRPPHFQATWRMYRESPNWTGLIEPKGFEHVARRVWRGYLGCVTHVDHALGELLDYLQRTGKAANTIVIYISDHGAYSGTHGLPEKAPGICSESVCRVPCIWRAPGTTKGGHVCPQFVENIDLAPTLTALCGLPAMETVDGKDISGLLRGEDAPVRDVAVTEHPWSKSIRFGPWRLVHYQPEMFGGQDVGELYDVVADPEERRNLYHDPARGEVVEQGRRLLLEWLIRTSRFVTAWPPIKGKAYGKFSYAIAGDGKESNQAGGAARVAQGSLNYL